MNIKPLYTRLHSHPHPTHTHKHNAHPTKVNAVYPYIYITLVHCDSMDELCRDCPWFDIYKKFAWEGPLNDFQKKKFPIRSTGHDGPLIFSKKVTRSVTLFVKAFAKDLKYNSCCCLSFTGWNSLQTSNSYPEGNVRRNQLQDGSIGLSPLCIVQT